MSNNPIQDRLDAAVDQFIQESEWGQGLVTTGWILVVHQQGFGEEGEPVSALPIAYMGGSMADPTALGLLKLASDTIRGIGKWGLEDE